MCLLTNFLITVMKKTSYDLECTPSIEVSRYDVERSPDVVAHRNTPSGER